MNNLTLYLLLNELKGIQKEIIELEESVLKKQPKHCNNDNTSDAWRRINNLIEIISLQITEP